MLHKIVLWTGRLWMCAALVLMSSMVVSAHAGTGTPVVSNEDIGPYRIYVWTDPDPPQVGEYHVAIALTESLEDDPTGFAGDAVLDADVQVTMTHGESGQQLSGEATHENSVNRIFYETIIDVPDTGNWDVRVEVNGPDGPADVSYTQTFQEATIGWQPLAAAGAAFLLLLAALLLWLKQQGPAAEPAEAPL